MPRLPIWFVAMVAIAAGLVFLPFLPQIALAVWLGIYARNLHIRIERRLRVGSRVAATITIGLLLLIAIPVGAVLTSIVIDTIALVQDLVQSEQTRGVLTKLVQTDVTQPPPEDAPGAIDLLISQGDRAWSIGRQLAGAAAHFVVGLLVIVTGAYGVLVNGRDWYHWLADHGPIARAHLDRFADAFVETGRGLWFGIVGAGMIQSAIATIAYLVLGVPSAFALGLLTLLFSVVPAIGTALVWAPVAAGLAMTGRPGAAIALAVTGVAVISTVDNLARPFLARKGKLQLPTWAVLVSMFGGIELIGGWGILIGPLVVRLAKEALMIWRAEDSPLFTISGPGSAGPTDGKP
jgi:predicted PurR-regulated permease PerM